MRYSAALQLDGKTATGIRVPGEIVTALGGGNRPRVRVTVASYTYQTTVARMRGEFTFPVSAAVRDGAGIAAGDRVDVEIEIDSTSREVTIPTELAKRLDGHPGARSAFEKLSYSNQKRHVLAVESAKSPETRERRIATTLDELSNQR
jgi:bifunctional DNA-binding transcriptional regulator/antitoxin component of YhaV-PrlF toxin-antitoxin module